jgi:SAM-dependent methyltransferase
MDHDDHLALLRPGIPAGGGYWADLGAGEGAFTLALAELLGPGARLIAVDRDGRALERLRTNVTRRFPDTRLTTLTADFTRPLDLPPLDGLLMANSLHFVERQEPVVTRLAGLLRPGGRFLLVEYNVDRGNHWVPFPLSFASWQALAERCGLPRPRLLASRPSRFLSEIYAAASY